MKLLLLLAFFLPLVLGGLDIHIHYDNPDPNVRIDFLTVRGDGFGLSWNEGKRAEKVNDTEYVVRVDCESQNSFPSQIQFKSLINDSIWQVGANEVIDVLSKDDCNEGRGKNNFFPWFFETSGKVEYLSKDVWSHELNNTRDIVAYLPPSYFENLAKRVEHLLIMHDGNNIFDIACPTCCPNGCWKIEDTLNGLIAEGGMREILVLGVFNTPNRLSEYTYSQDSQFLDYPAEADLYLDFLESTVIPLAEKLRLSGSRSQGILGSSLGGLVSAYAGWTRPNVWDIAGVMSASFWWNGEDFNADILKNGTATSRGKMNNATFYLDSGTGNPPESDDDEFETIRVRQSLEMLGKELGSTLFYALDVGGQHNEASWGDRFWKPMTLLYST